MGCSFRNFFYNEQIRHKGVNMTILKDNSNNPFQMSFDVDSLPDEKRNENVYLFEWLKNDGESVEKGQPLYRIRIGEYFGGYMCFTSQPIAAKESGIVQKCREKGDAIQNGDIICII